MPPASSATEGFFQPRPKLENQYLEDASYRRVIAFFVPEEKKHAITDELTRWGAKVLSPQVLRWVANAEAQPPTLQLRDSFGLSRNELITSEGWRCLQDLGLREGIVAMAYEKKHGIHNRVAQFLKMFLWCGSSSTVTCPSAMQDGAAALIKLHLKDPETLDVASKGVLKSAFGRLTSRDPTVAWTSGQWMTERSGGSDVSGTETRARKLSEVELKASEHWTDSHGEPLGPWSIDGFKWFSSATDADMTMLLAKNHTSEHLSLFFAPTSRLRPVGGAAASQNDSVLEFNGISPQRLKTKLGTKALPTAELELKGMRAYMLGKEGQGTKEISTILNITRVYNSVSSVGAFGRGLGISRAFARVRRVAGGKLLMNVPAHVKGMAEEHVQYRGNMMLVYFVVYVLGIYEADEVTEDMPLLASQEQAAQLLRLLTPVAKAMTALASIHGLRFCMESLGGLGYLENEDIELNVAKVFRDTNVLSIWEGTTDVMAADTVRVLTGHGAKEILEALQGWIKDVMNSTTVQASGLELGAIPRVVQDILRMVGQKEVAELLYCGRELLELLNWCVSTILLVADASRDRDPVALEIAERWLARQDPGLARSMSEQPFEDRVRLDREIVFGPTHSQVMGHTSRL